MEKPEIIVNLWYVHDEEGFIHGLRGRTYLGSDSDEEKLSLLQKYAVVDYYIAHPFNIPSRLYVKGRNVTHKSVMDLVGSADFFSEVFDSLNKMLPLPRYLKIPDQPLICVTPLTVTDRGGIIPSSSGQEFYQ